LVDFFAGARLLVRVFDALREAPERADVLELVLLPDGRGGEPAPDVVPAFARDRGGEGTRVAMGQQRTRSSLAPHLSHAGS
jgi:hypothetical protein